jgi:signal transduction histidine kinase/PAS domain-containing protein
MLTGDTIASALMLAVTIGVFVATLLMNRFSLSRMRKKVSLSRELSDIMQHTMSISHSYVVRLNLKDQHAHNLYGNLLPDKGIGYQEGFSFIHPDDHEIYRDFIIRLLKGSNDTEDCVFRWDFSGEKHLGQWRYVHEQGVKEFADGRGHAPTNFFCKVTDITTQIEDTKKEEEMSDRYREMFEQDIVGLVFYNSEGRIITTNKKLRDIFHFQSEEDPFYYKHTLYNMPAFCNLLDDQVTEDYYFCSKTVIPERGVNSYMEIRLHPINDDSGRLTYITCSVRDITEEREMYLENLQNEKKMRRAKEEMQQYEMELQYMMENCDMRFFRISNKDKVCTFYKTQSAPEKKMTIDEIIGHFLDSPFRQGLMEYENYFNVPRRDLTHMYPLFTDTEELRWNFIDSVPYFDGEGNFLGTYGVVRNVTKLIEKQERLRKETERANNAGQAKSVFMANMTHEIRTPLNSIVGFSDVLPMLTSPEEKQEIIKVIMNNCDMLLRLINDMLAISSLDEGGIKIVPQQVDFAKAFDNIFESLRERIQQSGVEFQKDNPYRSCVTTIDKDRVQQLMTNFVINASKYTHQGHIRLGYRIERRATEDGNTRNGLYLYCEDTGDGIPKESQGRIFERFVKLNDYVQGTGLGLSICKAIADACHGSIGVVSEGHDQGSTFWVWIPCEATYDSI